MKRCIVTYADGAHEELLDISLPIYKEFAQRHKYDMIVGGRETDLPAAWNKVHLLLEALQSYDQVVWLDCDLVIVNNKEDFPPMAADPGRGRTTVAHALVRHFEANSEVPNTGVWRLNQSAVPMLHKMLELTVFRDHGWWEQAALMTLMGYTVPPQDTHFPDTKCKQVQKTLWWNVCQFMRVCWNSHPHYRAERPRIVHCSYPNMLQRIEVMRALVKDPAFDYPRYDTKEKPNEEESQT